MKMKLWVCGDCEKSFICINGEWKMSVFAICPCCGSRNDNWQPCEWMKLVKVEQEEPRHAEEVAADQLQFQRNVRAGLNRQADTNTSYDNRLTALEQRVNELEGK